MPERIVIVGASIAGLATALALSHAGREIVVLERDAAPPEGSSHQVFETWERSGVPQLRHSHGFLARLRNLVRDRYPDLHVALLQAGAQERDLAHSLPPILAPSYTPHPRDDDLTTLLCRRTTFERVLDHYVRQQPGVRVATGVRATGVLTASGTSLPHLTGITASRAETSIAFAADTVIDASGRRSPFPAWLRALGAAVEEETEDTGIIYYTRFYRWRHGCEEPARTDHSSMGDLGYLKFGVFPADNQTFSLTLAIPTLETDLRILRHHEVFTHVCHALPALAAWLDPDRVEPTTDVLAMGGLQSCYRHVVRHGQPVVHGYFAVGEAAVHTNPLYGRGCSLSFMHAHLLADVLSTSSDPAVRALRFSTATEEKLGPFYHAAVRRDREGLRRAREGMQAHHTPHVWQRLRQSLLQHGLAPAMRGDLEVRRAFLRDFHMLEPPGIAIRRPDILLRILRFWLRGKKRNAIFYSPRSGPERTEMRQLLGLT